MVAKTLDPVAVLGVSTTLSFTVKPGVCPEMTTCVYCWSPVAFRVPEAWTNDPVM